MQCPNSFMNTRFRQCLAGKLLSRATTAGTTTSHGKAIDAEIATSTTCSVKASGAPNCCNRFTAFSKAATFCEGDGGGVSLRIETMAATTNSLHSRSQNALPAALNRILGASPCFGSQVAQKRARSELRQRPASFSSSTGLWTSVWQTITTVLSSPIICLQHALESLLQL